MDKFNDGGPEFFPCAEPCRQSMMWHRCRGKISCSVHGCVESGRNKGERTHPWGKTYWCGRCGGYIEYNPNIDTKYEGPWT